MRRIVRALIYLWTLPTTCVGLATVLPTLLSGGRIQWVAGVLEVHGGFVRFVLSRLVPLKGGASAMTLGHVVIGQDAMSLERTRAHERIHVRQCELWGPLFIPAYLGASLVILLRGGDPYLDNPFEREAYENS